MPAKEHKKPTGLENAASKVTNPTAKKAIARNQARRSVKKTAAKKMGY